MKHSLSVCLVFVFSIQLALAQGPQASRTWTARTGGQTLQAQFVAYDRGAVALKLPNGRTTSIAIANLSDADQQYVTAHLRPARKWTDKSGNTVDAHLISASADAAVLLTAALKPITVKCSSMSADDLKYLREEFPLPLKEKILGKWEGVSWSAGYVSQHRIEIKKLGTKIKAYDMVSRGMTDEEVSKAEKRQFKPQKGNDQYYFALRHEYDVTIEGETITFKGTKAEYRARDSDMGTWTPDNYIGEFKAADMIAGQMSDGKHAEGVFYFTRTGGSYDHSEPTDLEKGKTHKMTCTYDNRYHFSLYIPKSYDPKKAAPLVVNDSPGRNAKPFSTKMAEEKGWIMIGLTESGNNVDWAILNANCHAAILDVRRMLNIDSKRYYFTGLSGGSRRSASRAICYADSCAGVICIGAGYCQRASAKYLRPPTHIPIFYIVGQTDMNRKEVIERIIPEAKKRGRQHQLIVHPGGHTWGRAEDHEAAINWLDSQWKPL